jgi:ComEC/Rec2-related protein
LSLAFAALVAGLALGRAGITAGWPVAILAVGLTIAAWSLRSRLFIVCLILAALGIGTWRVTSWQASRTSLTTLIGHSINITATVVDDPSTGAHGQLDFVVSSIRLNGNPQTGTISVHSYPVFLQRGYQVQLSGKVKTGFGANPVELSFPKIQVLSRHQSPLEQWRQRFFAGIRTALPEPLASFGLGLLVGIRALIPKPMQAQLALVGLSHLVAVSGYNLTIIVSAAHRLLRRFGRGIALAASLWLIGGFLVLTGATASIVRASLVSVLSLLAAFYGRRFHPLTLITLTGAATAFFNPTYLTDLGWLLSFLAFFGILVLAPAIEARLGHPRLVVARLLIESVSAQILTVPLIMCFFSQLSIVSPITNFLVLPLVPLAMATAFLAGLAGMLIPAFCGWFAWPAVLILDLMLGIIGYFSHLPWAGTQDHLSLVGMLAAYAFLLIITITLARANHRRPKARPQPALLEPVHF